MPATKSLDAVARDRVRTWVASTGITETERAARIGKNQAWLSRYLSGGLDADLETLQRIGDVFGHSVSALLDLPADPAEARILTYYRALSVDARALVLALLEDWSGARRRSRGRARTRGST